jgi:hypothetical protein
MQYLGGNQSSSVILSSRRPQSWAAAQSARSAPILASSFACLSQKNLIFPEFADLHHFDEELDPGPDQDQTEKFDSDPHQRDADPQYCKKCYSPHSLINFFPSLMKIKICIWTRAQDLAL